MKRGVYRCLVSGLALVLALSMFACFSKSGDDDDDDDASADDDNGSDDDQTVDDDESDDDVEDDDTTDDDNGDDDAADDDNDDDDTDVWFDSNTGLTWQNSSSHEVWSDAVDYCGSLVLGNNSDWRLPTISELRSLIDGCSDTEAGGACGVTDECLNSGCSNSACENGCSAGGGSGPNGAYWPAELTGGEYGSYWSSSSVTGQSGWAWHIDFTAAAILEGNKTAGDYVRCVRGSAPAGTWSDVQSGLMWQVQPVNTRKNWEDAQDECDQLTIEKFADWRVPTVDELRSLIRGCEYTETGGACEVVDGCLETSCQNSACDGCTQGGGPASGCYWPVGIEGVCSGFWTSSPVSDNQDNAWFVHFLFGEVHNDAKTNADSYVRCVRGE